MNMNDRRRILLWLSFWVTVAILFEICCQYNWQSYIPRSELDELVREIAESAKEGLPLQFVTWDDSRQFFPDGFNTKSISHSVLAMSDSDIVPLRDSCCNGSNEVCKSKLSEYSAKHSRSLKFWFFHDPSCSGTAEYDNVGFSSSRDPRFIEEWAELRSIKPNGVLGTIPPISVVRLLMVQSVDKMSRVEWSPERLVAVERVLESVSVSTEIVFESQLVYSGDPRVIKKAMKQGDAYERSRMLNEELAVWKGSPHLLHFGVHAMPPIIHISIVLSGEENGEVYEVTDFGAVIFKSASVNSDQIIDIAVSVLRKWFGLTSGACSQEGACILGFSVSERIAIATKFRLNYMKNIVSSLEKQLKVLSALPRLKFGQDVSDLMLSAIRHGTESIREDQLRVSTEKAKKGAMEALEVLSHGSVTSIPFFSWEYRLALYGPLVFPIAVPLVAAWISIFSRKNSAEMKKLE